MLQNYVLPMIVTLIAVVAFVVFFTIKMKNADEHKKLLPVRIAFFLLVALEFAKIFYLIGTNNALFPNRYPIVFCSMVFFAYPLFCFRKNKFSQTAMAFSTLPCFVVFILFSVTNTSLNLSIIQAHSYLFHGVMLAVAIYLITAKVYRFRFPDFFSVFLCLASYVILAMVLSLFIGGNISYFGPTSVVTSAIYDMIGYAYGNALIIALMFLLSSGTYGAICGLSSLIQNKRAVTLKTKEETAL